MQSVDKSISTWLAANDPDGSRYLFNGICKYWESIVGPELAELVKPLGRKKTTLILGARDSIVIQEATFLSGQILEMINRFCGSVFFDKVRVELLKGRTPLDRELVNIPAVRYKAEKPPKLGGLKDIMKKDSPVARCYVRYVDHFRKKRTDENDTDSSNE